VSQQFTKPVRTPPWLQAPGGKEQRRRAVYAEVVTLANQLIVTFGAGAVAMVLFAIFYQV
jgi:hypothetical protein